MRQTLLTSSEAPELEKRQTTKTQRTEKAIQNPFLPLIKLYVIIFTMYTLQNIKVQAKLSTMPN